MQAQTTTTTTTTTQVLNVRAAAKKKRGYSHTKLGCKTCKTRKVRCDETWPSCHNCKRYGIKCDGVRGSATGVVHFTTPMTRAYFRLSHNAILQPHEVAYLDLFRHRFIHSIVGGVTRPAWEQLMLQAIHQEPALCHAAVAYSALVGMDREGPGTGVITPEGVAMLDINPAPNKELALRHYNQCIKGLQSIVGRRDDVNVALLCILLCISFELRFKNPYLALTHLAHSLKIVKSSTVDVDDDLVMAFARMDMEASVFSSVRVPSLETQRLANCKIGVLGYQGTDNDLTRVTNDILTFIRVKVRANTNESAGTPVPQQIRDEASDLSMRLDSFRQTQLAVDLPDKTAAAALAPEAKILWLKYLTIHVMLGTCLASDEMVFDDYLVEMTALVIVADKAVEDQEDVTNQKSSIDMAVIPALYLVGQKCRQPAVRRACLQTLARIHDLEGVWDVTLCTKYARRLMELEEENLSLDPLQLDEVDPGVVVGSRRITSLGVMPDYDNQCSTLTYHRPASEGVGEWTKLVEILPWK